MNLKEPPQPEVVDHKHILPPIRPFDLRLLTQRATLPPLEAREFVLGPQKPLFLKMTASEARSHVP